MNIQDLLDHYNEVKSTLSNGLVGRRARDYASNFNSNLQTNFPALNSNPTLEDIVNTSLNIGGIGSIRRPKDIMLPYSREYKFLQTPAKSNVIGIGVNHSGNENTIVSNTPDISPTNDVQELLNSYIFKNSKKRNGTIFKTYDDNLHNSIVKYNDNYATDSDELVKAIDEGSIVNIDDLIRHIDYKKLIAQLNSDGANIKLKVPKDLQKNSIDGAEQFEEDFASIVRELFGTSKISNTAKGNKFENNNDLFALQNTQNPLWTNRFTLDNYLKYKKPGSLDEMSLDTPHLAKMYDEFVKEVDSLKLNSNIKALPGNFKDRQLTFIPPFSADNFNNSYKNINGVKGQSLSEILSEFLNKKKAP